MAKLLISFDGGGIRGAATGQLVKLIHEELLKTEDKKLINYFDGVAGTSTGCLISTLMMSGYSGNDISEIYNQENAEAIFDSSIIDDTLGLLQHKPKYDGQGKIKTIKEKVGEKRLRDIATDDRLFVAIAYDVEKRVPFVWCSEDDSNPLLSDICDSSSAAPCYFPTIKTESGQYLIDGGVVQNNPALTLYAKAKKKWPKEDIRILSIGTGYGNRGIDGEESKDYGVISWMANGLMSIFQDEHLVDDNLKDILGDRFMRVNSPLKGVSDDMDCIEEENLQALKDLGERWWNEFGPGIIDFIKG